MREAGVTGAVSLPDPWRKINVCKCQQPLILGVSLRYVLNSFETFVGHRSIVMQVVCYFGKAAHQGKVTLPTDSLLAECEDFAQRNGLTGLFAISDGYFLHLLEGDDAAVQGLVSRIAA